MRETTEMSAGKRAENKVSKIQQGSVRETTEIDPSSLAVFLAKNLIRSNIAKQKRKNGVKIKER